MSENRIRRTAVAAALVAAAWGAFSTARAQASGTLQASVTVLDDRVSQVVRKRLAEFEDGGGPSAHAGEPRGKGGSEEIAATVTELPRVGAVRRIRVEVAYLN